MSNELNLSEKHDAIMTCIENLDAPETLKNKLREVAIREYERQQRNLKPCPFCGEDVMLKVTNKVYNIVYCPKCEFWLFQHMDVDQTIKKWNCRKEPTP